MRITRQSRLLNDAIEALDIRLKEAKGDVREAWTRLSSVEMQFVKEEITNCITDRTYYLQNFHVVIPESGTPTCIYPFWDSQARVDEVISELRAKQGWSKVLVLKYRQAGLSEYATGVMCHSTFFTPHAYTIAVAQNPAVAAHLQRKANISYDYLPWWLRPERQYHNKGEYLEFNRKDESSRSSDPGLGSVFLTTHAQAEGGVAIGRTCRNLMMTELCWWGSGEIYTSDIEPTMNAPDTMAIAESTGLRNSGFFHNWVQDCLAHPDETDWTLVFLPAYRARKFFLATKPSFKRTDQEEAMVQRVLSEEGFQITDGFLNWRRFRIRAAIQRDGNPYAHYAAYPTTVQESFQSSSLGAFPRHKLDEQGQTNIRTPKWHGEVTFQGLQVAPRLDLEELPPGFPLPRREKYNRFWMWETPKPASTYYVAADASGGKEGNDFACAQVFRADTGSNPDVQVAEWNGWISPTDFAKVLYSIGMYYNKCEVAVEYEREGMVTAAVLTRELQYENVYRPRRDDVVGAGISRMLHWTTNYKTKRQMIVCMKEALLTDTVVIRSSLLLNQMYKFVAKSVDDNDIPISFGGEGDNDDAIISACICLFCLRQTLPEMRSYTEGDGQDKSTITRSAKPSGGSIIYGIYNALTQQITQTRDLAKAQEAVAKNPGWFIKPIIVSQANTFYSPIYHSRNSPENAMLREGVDQFEITPGMAQLYRAAQAQRSAIYDEAILGSGGSTLDEWNRLAEGNFYGVQD
jgi:hypothetical protein